MPKTPSYPHIINDIVGIDEDVEELVEKLILEDDTNHYYGNCQALSIFGMGGSGKTTLARKIYNHPKIKHNFDCQAWVSVSQEWHSEVLLREIFRQTSKKNCNTLTIEHINEELHQFVQANSCLVVLDDVWEQTVLRQIMVPATSRLTRFIITTRKQDVQFRELRFFEHEARRLTEDESHELFKKIAFSRHDRVDKELMDLGEEMLRKCDGLPLAIISLAGILSTKKCIHDWEMVKRDVTSKIMKEGPLDYGGVEEVLSLSYYDLDPTLKSCFLYTGLFPEDAEIPTGSLMRMWIAECFVLTNDNSEDLATECLDKLIQRCLFQIESCNYAGKVKTIKIHDLQRDLGLKKAKEKHFMDTISSSSSNIGARTTIQSLRLGVLDGDTTMESNWSRIRSLVQFVGEYRYPIYSLEPIWKYYKLLRVLDIGIKPGIVSSSVTFMPEELGNLIHLRYLALRSENVLQLPKSLENLINLQTIKFWSTNECDYEDEWLVIPNLRHMKHLRHLRLPGKVRLSNEDELELKDLVNLQVVWNIRAGPWLKHLSPTVQKLYPPGIESLEQLQAVYQCPSIVKDHLRTLQLIIETFDLNLLELEKLKHCKKLQKLVVWGEIAQNAPLAFPSRLLMLELRDSLLELQDSFMALSYLKVLDLGHDAYIGSQLTFDAGSFPHLERLKLNHLPCLKKLILREGALPRLNRLHIMGCYQLKALPPGLKIITTLEGLWIRQMSDEFNVRLRQVEDGRCGGEDFHIIENIPYVEVERMHWWCK